VVGMSRRIHITLKYDSSEVAIRFSKQDAWFLDLVAEAAEFNY